MEELQVLAVTDSLTFFDPSDHGYDIGITRMRVVTRADGSIKTAIPEQGSSIKAYVPGHGWIIKDGS